MTHADLVVRAVSWLRGRHNCPVVFAEMATRVPMTMDALGFTRAGICHAVECKRTRSDFHADRKKVGHRCRGMMPGDLRWYLTPPALLRPDDLPDGWGLAEVHARRVVVVVEASRQDRSLTDRRVDVEILVSACHRHQIGVVWWAHNARFAPFAAVLRESPE